MFREKRERLKGLSFNRMVPNILTVLALCAGLTAIRFGFQERWEAAIFALFVAAIFDGLDGRIARLMGATSEFGAMLDSLSDFLSFGVAPAILLYFWTMQQWGVVGWALVLLYGVCCALRLARFNTQNDGEGAPPWSHNFFVGVPSPAAAALVLLPMMLSFVFGDELLGHPIASAAFLFSVSILMISRVPTYSFKNFRVPNRYVLPTFLFVGLIAAFVASEYWATLSALTILYLASIPLSMRSHAILKRETARLQEAGEDDVDNAGEEKPR
ncbi:CDP-diacylglycerol--serine O-phosphatidyltransferase [Rhodospirillaceae bacterium AH-315-P19]|nr:CDP-diacylglycerol--serine O-phosphatidyltransferase [Rhodospirillaceae bacterium AH-315-P19]